MNRLFAVFDAHSLPVTIMIALPLKKLHPPSADAMYTHQHASVIARHRRWHCAVGVPKQSPCDEKQHEKTYALCGTELMHTMLPSA